MANNKIELADGTTLLDLTEDTVTPQTMLRGTTAHDRSGTSVTGVIDLANASSSTPAADSENGDAGSSTDYARGDHSHPVTESAANLYINSLAEATGTPQDADYYVSQYTGGGTAHPTYYRRPFSTLWNYIKSKITSSVITTALGYTPPQQDTTYGVVSKSANGLAPQLPNETTTTKFLRQDGTWNVPKHVTYEKLGWGTSFTFHMDTGTHALLVISSTHVYLLWKTGSALSTPTLLHGASGSYVVEESDTTNHIVRVRSANGTTNFTATVFKGNPT